MKGDNIYLQSKKDLLIVRFGNSYLKKHKREGLRYACSNRMRELSRLLISVRKMMENENMALKDILHPKYFDNVISPVRNIEGYDAFKKSFKGPSLAMHLGTSLKLIYNELIHLILKGDIKKFREETLNVANTGKELFFNNNDNDSIYKDLIQCVLSLLIVFNRRRVGDVPFLKLSEYQRDTNHTFTDFDSVLTNTEKILTEKYKRVLTSGKGSRAVVILIPKVIQDFIDIDIISENSQVFPEDFLPL
ncbi:hypothetical protein NQ318_018233 [Aromia moschata]|uniref:Uncharacterized protein n=1 Tax=Aromia moschata TaxID=1265417 RepID=A0AAV8ZFB9_9CUCU|nr:hypothetical protein NQ318_005082 [Aromia moschata]KAJ8962258.1 hypothetical protein NQ318_018233 [Aromia moschata]